MKGLVLIGCMFLMGCAGMEPKPYFDIGAAIRVESGDYGNIDETGCVGILGGGWEFNDTEWYQPSEVGIEHRSQCWTKPEISTYDLQAIKRFGGQ